MTDAIPVRLIVEGACSVPSRYVAPEVLAGRGVPCDQKGDIWSLGCTSSQMLFGRRPYESIRNDFHIPFAVARHVAPYSAWDSSDPCHETLQSCLERGASLRASACDVVERLGNPAPASRSGRTQSHG
ncbi:uncharacterized protein EI90DRAFT_3064777 [Cantharellus anzutake]|uniref:uncharacterized protein n=1 Tax=Cantharellus anzutake TaxID=1750568 RepID=UPI00190861B6|nr:uncharacterized protein EI90DRAFT_3064777 [Cantharellus anzutake]KAF8328601.1 hypothetical protein EI90DRAFT_3064777 [Cantharellus anzutake]